MPFPILSQSDFHPTLATTPGTSVVIFSSATCGRCRYWKELLATYQALEPDVTVFEVDAARDTGLAREFDVLALPALFVFRDGVFHGRLECEPGLDALRVAIAALLAAPAQP
jgi:thioredoxin-like negative regulator of GroEL